MVPFSNAAAAYANTQMQGIKAPGAAAETSGASFGDMLKEAGDQAIQTLDMAEQKSLAGAVGKADLTDVVNAVTNAEMTLQAVVSVRDRVVSAYQEILRMPM
ncbi:MAG: flagellar hook-basal body complex protein FliE [Pseudomonadota bacterium]|jgi:flagellar hook-basal body complex protein FliE